MAVAQGGSQLVARGRGLMVPAHHLDALGQKGLQQELHQGLQRHLEQPQERPAGPGVDGDLGGLFLRQQGLGVQGQLHPPGRRFLDLGGVVNHDPVRGQLVLMQLDGLLVQGHQQVHPFPGGNQGPIRDPDQVEQVPAADAGLIGLDKQDLAALAHQGLGQGCGDGVHPLPRRPADQDVEINGHSSALSAQTRLIVNNYSSDCPCQYK